jgi:hypothetical protein
MDTIPAGFIPDEWNQTFAAFKRLVEHLDAMRAILTECSELTSENCDVAYIRNQVRSEVDTLQFMTSDAEKHWKARVVAVASAAGRFNLNRPVGFVAWCDAVLDAAWNLCNGLSGELSGQNAELCVHRLPLHLGKIPNDIGHWRESIRAELRAGALCHKENRVSDDDPFSIGRKTSDWKTLNPKWTEKMFEGLRNKNRNSVQDTGGKGRGPWQFRRSLCRANNLKCPEFDTDIS